MLIYVIEVSATGSIQWCLTKSFCFLLWGFALFKEEDKLINFLLYMYKVIKNRSQPRAPSSFFDWNTDILLDFSLSKHLFFKHRAVHQNNMSIEYTVHYLARVTILNQEAATVEGHITWVYIPLSATSSSDFTSKQYTHWTSITE